MEVSLGALGNYAQNFIGSLPDKAGNSAYVLGLQGDLGAGKTTFVQSVAKALGVTDSVTSPTFVIAQTYKTTHPVFKKLVHIDAYRLAEEKKDTIGFPKLLTDPHALIFVEWPEYLPGGFPKNALILSFRTIDETTRAISYA